MNIGRQNSRHAIATWLLAGFMAVCIGCGGSDLSTVEGTVTFDGEPVEEGSIVFEPADGVGPAAGGTIEQGRYRLAGDAGVVPGQKTVRISAVRSTGRQVEAGSPAPEGTMVDEVEQYIPVQYNQKTTLTAEVPPGQVTLDFDLQASP